MKLRYCGTCGVVCLYAVQGGSNFEFVVACEQAPKRGIGRKGKLFIMLYKVVLT